MNATTWTDAVGWGLLHFVWQGAAAAIALAVGLGVARTPAVRYRLSAVALVVLPALPLITVSLLRPNRSPAPPLSVQTAPVDIPAVSPRPVVHPVLNVSRPTSAPPHDPMEWVVAGWGVGTVVLGLVNGVGYLRVRRLRRAGVQPAGAAWEERLADIADRVGVRRVVRLLESAAVATPAVVGHVRPIILLPVSLASGLTVRQIEMVLAHELAHVRRCDFAVNLCQAAVETALFYHPAVWWISGRVRREREACCDEIAVTACDGDRLGYARTLADLEAWRSLPRPAVAAATAPVVRRVRRLVGLRDPWRAGPAALAAVAAIACAVVPLATSRLRAAAPTPSPATIILRVLTPGGRPAAGARVTVTRRADAEDEHVLARAVADADGVARLPPSAAGGVAVAEVDGCGLTTAPVPDREATVRLLPSNVAKLAFIGPDGRPVPGLLVEPRLVMPVIDDVLSVGPTWGWLPPDLRQRLGRRTDPDGIVTFDQFGPHQQVTLKTPDDRWAELDSNGDRLVTSQSVTTPTQTVRLYAAATVGGTVRYGTSGRPAVGVRVSAQTVDDALPHGGWGESVTDAAGRYEIRRLPPGQYNVAPDLEKGGLDHDWTAAAHERLEVLAGARLDALDLTLIHGVELRGDAIDADTGKPLAGARIGIYGPAHPASGGWVQTATTDAAGRFTARVPPGKQHVYAYSTPAGYTAPDGIEVTTVDGGYAELRFAFPPHATPSCGGRVVRADGSPAGGATVVVDPQWRAKGVALPYDVTADADGRFHVDSAPVGTLLRARAPDGGGTAAAVRVGRVGRNQLVLRLAAGRVEYDVTVQVVGPDRRPIPGASVMLLSDGPTGYPDHRTDAEGRFRFEALYPDHTYSVEVSAEGFGEEAVHLVGVVPGRAGQVRQVMLDRADGTVAGRVTGGPGPWDGIWVALRGGQHTLWTSTDKDGRFRFDHVDGTNGLSVRAEAPWGNLAWQSVQSGATDVPLSFPEPATRPVAKPATTRP